MLYIQIYSSNGKSELTKQKLGPNGSPVAPPHIPKPLFLKETITYGIPERMFSIFSKGLIHTYVLDEYNNLIIYNCLLLDQENTSKQQKSQNIFNMQMKVLLSAWNKVATKEELILVADQNSNSYHDHYTLAEFKDTHNYTILLLENAHIVPDRGIMYNISQYIYTLHRQTIPLPYVRYRGPITPFRINNWITINDRGLVELFIEARNHDNAHLFAKKRITLRDQNINQKEIVDHVMSFIDRCGSWINHPAGKIADASIRLIKNQNLTAIAVEIRNKRGILLHQSEIKIPLDISPQNLPQWIKEQQINALNIANSKAHNQNGNNNNNNIINKK